jgi:hypothetical protein
MDVGGRDPAILRECRELMTGRLHATVMRVVDEVARALERQIAGGDPVDPGSSAFDAVRELRQRRGEIAVRFEHRFNEFFAARLAAAPVRGAGPGPLPAGCRALLLEIDRRLRPLVADDVRSPVSAPLEPATLLSAFGAACADVAAGEPVRRALVELFRRHMEADLPRVYGELNALLVRQGLRGSPRAPRRCGSTVMAPFATLPGRRPTIYGQGRSRIVAPSDDDSVRQVRALLGVHAVPYFVRAFALDVWARVMSHIRTGKGEGSVEWTRALKTLEDLVASVEMFTDPDCRRLVLWSLPGLVRRLKAGMNAAAIPQQEQVLFLKTLRAHHLRLLGQREAGTAPEIPDDV